MDLSTQKEMAADVLSCGKNKVWINPERQDDVADAITKADVRRLIQKGAIKKKSTDGQSRGRVRNKKIQEEKGRRSGHGSKKGNNQTEKKKWMSKVRAQRKLLKELRDKGDIDSSTYRDLYQKSKGGRFNSKKHLMEYMKKGGLIEKGDEIE